MATPAGGRDDQTPAIRLRWFRRLLGHFEPGSLADLGAGHGVFALAAADLGWQVTALDARGDRYPDDPRVAWAVGDVREFEADAHDVVACLGLFYHLTLADQLDLLRRCAGTPIILDTHVANGQESPFELSEEVIRRGYRGRLYREGGPRQSTASWGNRRSFWPTPRAQQRMLVEHGYDVLEAQPWYLPTRTFWLCLPR